MKWLTDTFAAIALFASCSTHTAYCNTSESTVEDCTGCDYTANATAIEQKKQEMLAVADSVGNFWFSDDTEFQSQDPHAYWLMNRMMQMVQLVKTADDDWAWMLAMNESIEEYNTRLGRKIGSPDAACNAIKELIIIYSAGNQPEMNTATYVMSILAHYRTVNRYHDLIEFINDYDKDSDWDVKLKLLYYREFKAWFDLNNAVNGIMYFYTYAAASYSALPMELNGTFGMWSKKRLAELETESDIYWSYDWKPFESDAARVSDTKFNRLLDHFASRTKEDVYEEFFAYMHDEDDIDYEYAEERVGRHFDFEKIANMLNIYRKALAEWRQVRKQIAGTLPMEKQQSYREITKQMHTRLYNELSELKKISH